MFRHPSKDLVANSDALFDFQVSLDSGATWITIADLTNTSPANAAHMFQIPGFLNPTRCNQLNLLAAATRIVKTVSSAGVAGASTFTVTSTAAAANAAFKVTTESLDLMPTLYQNVGVTKRYQISSAGVSAADIATKMAAAINGDPNSLVTASVAAAVVTVTAKDPGVKVGVYSSAIAGTLAETVVAALPVNTYDYLKNIIEPVNLDFDRNQAFFPEKGVSYNSYYFELLTDPGAWQGNVDIVGAKNNQVIVPVTIYAKSTLAQNAELDFFIADMNV